MQITALILAFIYLPLFLVIGYYGAKILEKYGEKSLSLKLLGYLCTFGFTPIYLISALYYFELYNVIYFILAFMVVMFYIYLFHQ